MEDSFRKSRGDRFRVPEVYRLIKSTKYIPKRLLTQVQQMEQQKTPVREVLMLLGVVE